MLETLRQPGGACKTMTNNVSCGASSKNNTRVGQPSAAIGPHRAPAAAIRSLWAGVKRGYGFPPSNSPRRLF